MITKVDIGQSTTENSDFERLSLNWEHEVKTQIGTNKNTHFYSDFPALHKWILYHTNEPLAIATLAMSVEEKCAEVHLFYVVEGKRGIGHGDSLIARIEEEARSQGLERLLVNVSNCHSHADELFTERGFQLIPVDSPNIDGSSFVMMEKFIQ